MRLSAAIALLVLLPLACVPARATDEPEAVYAKYHRAVMAGDLEEMVKYVPTPTRAEIYAMSASSKEATLKMAQYMMPRAFTLQRKTVQPNGHATLIVSGPWTGDGRKMQTMYGIVRMITENGEMKVDESSWTSEKPANLATPQPAAPQPAAPPAAADKAAPKAAVSTKGAPVVGTMSSSSPGRVLGKAKPPCVYKPVMTTEDIENCK
jgi:hypothetical protein